MPQETIFSPREQLAIEGHEYLRSFSTMTRDQLTGLVGALGDYASRVGPTFEPVEPSHHESIEAHRMLIDCYWQAPRALEQQRPAWAIVPESLREIANEDPVFDPAEQATLRLHKYIRRHEGLQRREMLSVLIALGRYSRDAQALRVLPHVSPGLVGVTRIIHGHNALISFSDRPFTLEEFGESARAVLRGEASRLTRSLRRT